VVARIGRCTEFGSPVVLGVAAHRCAWVGVITPALPNGRLGCILALSGHQSHRPPGWHGGTRIAIHGGTIGGSTSAGCVHAGAADLRYLMATVPLGTPVTIRGR
jgi:hypothetical protein